MVIFFRRIPIMMALKPFIPDVKTWREALFAGHFGPIGVGAIFAAILARAELETDTTTPLAVLPEDPKTENYAIIHVIWPLTTFLVITSIIVHGSSIAVFTLGKRINTLTLTMSYTQANEEGPSWMNRLPRIQSTGKSMSKAKSDYSSESSEEKLPEYPPGTLPPIGMPGNFLRRQKDEDTPIEGRRVMARRKSKWDSGMGPGGPISASAITPVREKFGLNPEDNVSETLNEKGSLSPKSSEENEPPDQIEMEIKDEQRKKEHKQQPKHTEEPILEAYQEGHDLVIEDEEGNIVSISDTRGETDEQKQQHVLAAKSKVERNETGEFAKGKFHPHEKDEGEEIEKAVEEGIEHPQQEMRKWRQRIADWRKHKDDKKESRGHEQAKDIEHKRGPAHAYQFGNTIIVEDEDGEVIKKYEMPRARTGRGGYQNGPGIEKATRGGLKRMGTWAGIGGHKPNPGTSDAPQAAESSTQPQQEKKEPPRWRRKFSAMPVPEDPDDDRIRFTVDAGGRRMSKQDFIASMRQLDPKARIEAVEESDAPGHVKEAVQAEAASEHVNRPEANRTGTSASKRFPFPVQQEPLSPAQEQAEAEKQAEDLSKVQSRTEDVPFHAARSTVSKYAAGQPESAAQRRRRQALERQQEEDSDDDGTERVPPHHTSSSRSPESKDRGNEQGETAAERRRRLLRSGRATVVIARIVRMTIRRGNRRAGKSRSVNPGARRCGELPGSGSRIARLRVSGGCNGERALGSGEGGEG